MAARYCGDAGGAQAIAPGSGDGDLGGFTDAHGAFPRCGSRANYHEAIAACGEPSTYRYRDFADGQSPLSSSRVVPEGVVD